VLELDQDSQRARIMEKNFWRRKGPHRAPQQLMMKSSLFVILHVAKWLHRLDSSSIANIRSDSQDIYRRVQNLNSQHLLRNNAPLSLVLRLMNPVHTYRHNFFQIHFNWGPIKIWSFIIVQCLNVQTLPDLRQSHLRPTEVKTKISLKNVNPSYYQNAIYLTTLWLNFLYLVEETFLLLFGNRRTTCFNPPRHVGGCTFHLISYFRLTTICSECILFVKSGSTCMYNSRIHSLLFTVCRFKHWAMDNAQKLRGPNDDAPSSAPYGMASTIRSTSSSSVTIVPGYGLDDRALIPTMFSSSSTYRNQLWESHRLSNWYWRLLPQR
jgi:hypothetical protein